MADAKRVLELRFSGVDDLSPKIAAITKEFDKSQASIDKFAAPIAGATEKLLALEAAVVAAGVALGVYAVTEAIKFQDATVELDKVLSDTDRTVQSFGDSAIALSNKYGDAAVAVQQSFAEFAAAGFAADEVEGLTESMLKLARVSELNVVEGTEAAVRILKGFGLGAKEIPAILDIVNESTNLYGTNVRQMTEALARVAPIAAQGNFSIAETVGVLTPVVEVFKDAEQAGSAFNTVIQRLTSDNKNVTDALSQLKVAQTDSNDKMRSAKDILHDVQKAYETLDPSQKATTTQMLAGTEQAAKFAIVFNNLKLTTDVTAQSLKGVGESVDKELTKRMAATSAVIDIFTARLNNAAIIAGGPFLDAVKRLAESGGKLGLVLQDLAKSEAFKTFAAAVSAQMDRAGVAVEKFAVALPKALEKVNLKAFNEQLKLLGFSFESLFDGIDLTTPEGLAKALQKIIDLGTNFLAFNRGVIEGMKPVLAIFRETFEILTMLDPRILTVIGTLSGFALGWTLLSPAISLAKSTLGGFGDLIGAEGKLRKSLGETATANTVLNASFLGLAGVVGTSFYQLGTAINSWYDQQVKAKYGFESLGAAAYAYVHGPADAFSASAIAMRKHLAGITEEQGKSTAATTKAIETWDVYGGGIDGITGKFAPFSQAAKDFTDALNAQGTAVAQLTPPWAALNKELEAALALERLTAENCGPLTEEMFLAGSAVMQLKNSVELAKDGFVDINGVWTQTTAASAGLAKTVETVGEKAEKAAEKAAKLVQESEKLELEWAKLESHEREVVFTAIVDLQIEKVKADADKFKSVMDSITKAIESTGETLLGFGKLYLDSQRTLGGGEILSLLRKEDERRTQSFELQKKMTESQLRYLDASTDRLRNGDALITINAAGIEPELRAVLFKIIELSHIEASGVAGPLLLGLPTI